MEGETLLIHPQVFVIPLLLVVLLCVPTRKDTESFSTPSFILFCISLLCFLPCVVGDRLHSLGPPDTVEANSLPGLRSQGVGSS